MSYKSKYKGSQVETMLDKINEKRDYIDDLENIKEGAEKGNTALQKVPDEYITETELDVILEDRLKNKVDKDGDKVLSTEDFTTTLKNKLESLNNYDDKAITDAVNKVRNDLDTLISGDTTNAIESFNEIIAFLEGIEDAQDLSNIIASIEKQIANKVDEVTLAKVAKSGSYNDLNNKPTIPNAVTESTVSGWGFTKNSGNYNKPPSGIPITDLESKAQTALSKTDAIDGMMAEISNLSANKQDTITDIETIRSNAYNGANAKIIASQIFLEMHPNGDLGNGVYVLKDKTGYEQHNLDVYKRMVANIKGTSDVNNEMFFATLNTNIGGRPYMYSALLNCENNEFVYGSFVYNAYGNDSSGGSIASIGADSEAIVEAALLDLLGEVAWKLSSKIIPSKEYVDSFGGGSVYVTEFNFRALTSGVKIPITTSFVEALNNKSVILVPFDRSGYLVATVTICNAIGYNINIELAFYIRQSIYKIGIYDRIPATVDGVLVVPSIIEDILTTSSEFKTINGESILGRGDIDIKGNVTGDWMENDEGSDAYIKNRTHCIEKTINLYFGKQISIPRRYIQQYRIIWDGRLIPFNPDSNTIVYNSQGYYVCTLALTDVNEDSFMFNYNSYDADKYGDTPPILGIASKFNGGVKFLDDFYLPSTVVLEDTLSNYYTKKEVNSAIASAITTTLNTPV